MGKTKKNKIILSTSISNHTLPLLTYQVWFPWIELVTLSFVAEVLKGERNETLRSFRKNIQRKRKKEHTQDNNLHFRFFCSWQVRW